MTKSEQQIIDNLRHWLATSEGQAKLTEIAQDCKQMRAELDEQSRVSWEDLYKPMDF